MTCSYAFVYVAIGFFLCVISLALCDSCFNLRCRSTLKWLSVCTEYSRCSVCRYWSAGEVYCFISLSVYRKMVASCVIVGVAAFVW